MNNLKTAFFLSTAIFLSSAASAAVITPYTSFSDFTSTTVFSNDFETTKDTPQFSFDSDSFLIDASSATGGVTSSPVQVLARSQGVPQPPLNAYLNVDAFEVGMFFGNDDGGYTGPVVLNIYDVLDNLLGTTSVNANGNDFADQFIGLGSDTAFRRVSIDYTQSSNLARVIDDFAIGTDGTTVPAPATLALLGLGLAGISLRRLKR